MRAIFVAVAVLASSPAVADPKAGSCEAVTKPLGKSLPAWKVPEGCTLKTGGRAPQLIASEADARQRLECKDPKAKLGVDFGKQQLVVVTRSFSPAQVGLEALDDGKKVTMVSRQRLPCPRDPRPMPGPDSAFAYTLTSGARTFAEASCNVETKCN